MKSRRLGLGEASFIRYMEYEGYSMHRRTFFVGRVCVKGREHRPLSWS